MATYLGSLVQLCCGEGGTLQTNTADVCGECSQWMDRPHWVCHSPRQHVLPGSRLISLQGALQGHCAKWALRFMHFPGLSRSGSQVLHKGTDPDRLCVLCPSQVRAAQATGCSLGHASNSPAWSPPLSFHKSAVPGVPYVSSGELIPGCDTPGRCQPSRIPRRRG